MPKFSAYMRGDKGVKGDTGQASVIDGITDINNLIPYFDLDQSKNHAYYVKKDDGIHLYFSKLGGEWQDLGLVTISFSTKQYGSISTLPWTPEGTLPQITITPHINQQITSSLKSFDFHFDIPEGQPAGFSTNQYTSITSLDWYENPTIQITPDENTPNYNKSFIFDFGVPKGRPGGFANEMGVSVTTLSSTSDATVSITPDETTPDYAKKFNFDFGIPHGVPGGFGNISVSTVQLEPTIPAEVSITTSGPESAKNFDFLFKIPKGIKGDRGDALGTYLGIEFTSTQADSTQEVYWVNNILHINRGENKKVPIYILNNDNNNIAATFKINENEILYEADSTFNGILYLIAASNIPTFKIGKCTTIPFEENPYVNAYYENENNPSEITLDFYLTKGSNQNLDGHTQWEDIEGNIQQATDLINLLNLKVNIEDLKSMAYIEDASYDNKIYGRKNGTWEEITINSSSSSSGIPGKGIVSITLENSENLIDTYTINYTDNTSSNFTVTNGNGISNISYDTSDGLVDIYRINYTNGTFDTFTITNGESGGGYAEGVGWENIDNNPFEFASIKNDGFISVNDASYSTLLLNNNLSLKTDKWETLDNQSYSEPFIYFHDSKGEKVGQISIEHKDNNELWLNMQVTENISSESKINSFKIGLDATGNSKYSISNTTNFLQILGCNPAWPIELGGTGAVTAEEAWTALGGGSIGKKDKLTATDIESGTFDAARIPSLAASKISAGTFTGDYKLTGTLYFTNTNNASNVSNPAIVIGTTTGEHLKIDQNEIMCKSNANTYRVFHLNSQGGGIRIGNGSTINKVTFTATDIAVNSALSTGNIVFVYES